MTGLPSSKNSRLRRWRIVLCFAAVAGFGAFAHAHGDLHDRIDDLTRRLKQQPANAALHLARGELFAQHGEYAEAEADFRNAAQLDAELPGLNLARARLLLVRREAGPAREYLDRQLARDSRDAEARVLRAQSWMISGERERAIVDFDAALQELTAPPPGIYLERASAMTDRVAAIRSLDEGIERLGPLPALHLAALRLEEEEGDTDAVLTRLATLETAGGRREMWLVRRAEILAQAGRREEARNAIDQARFELERLPARWRKSEEAARLGERIDRLDTEMAASVSR